MDLYLKFSKDIFESTPGFDPQFRLEGRARDPNNEDNLAMRVVDPLWMLGRQWQFGEFLGEDNGSPIRVIASYKKDSMRYYSCFSENTYHSINDRIPLEASIEAMPVFPHDLRSKVRIGQQLERFIRNHIPGSQASELILALRQAYPLEATGKLDEKSRRYLSLMANKVVDGGRFLAALKDDRIPEEYRSSLEKPIQQLTQWYEKLFYQPPSKETSAWDSRQLAHQFSLHLDDSDQPHTLSLHAPDYQSGHLDWYTFDKVARLKGDGTGNPGKQSATLTPINASFAAMPDKRLFAFENKKVDLGSMNIDPDDLVRIMLIDFSLVSGSDWFIVPMEMKLGELCWIEHLDVFDVFGVRTRIVNDHDTGMYLSDNPLNVWDVFKIRNNNPAIYDAEEAKRHFLFLTPASTDRLESPLLEEVLFLRDEYANMVWGVEKTALNTMGKSVNGFDLHLELNGPFFDDPDDEAASEMPRYRLASPVPTNWIPYLPRHIDDSLTEIELHRAMMVRNETIGEPEAIVPLTRLAREDLKKIREEAVPRAGVRVQLTRQRIRWTNGETYVWLGRKVLAGRGEGNSGLKFDQYK